jgi:alkanesulfonate monooxygenase SsuD/methylene tetrahydromethanopterin reductase-like flavin-dependent oxidoreductase (luciferase family)
MRAPGWTKGCAVRCGIDICTLGDFAEPEPLVDLARAAEAAGWEAVFVWDHVAFAWGVPSLDPWVLLAAMAQATTRILLGTAVTPLPRRRPAVVANAVATLDRLSGGRVIFGAGSGGVAVEFAAFAEPDAARVRAAQLDEALHVVAALWEGQPVSHTGKYYVVDGVTLAPLPVQRPRVPIWIGGHSRAAQRRAARWDGWIIGADNEQGEMTIPPQGVADDLVYIRRHRRGDAPFQVAMTGVSAGPDDGITAQYEAAGVTWWLEHLHAKRAPYGRLLSRVEAGPVGAS